MDTATLFAFAATYPTIFQAFMEDVAEHIVLETDESTAVLTDSTPIN